MAVFHVAALPYCYFDKYKSNVVIRLISKEEDVVAVHIIYGDPFNYIKTEDADGSAVYTWQYDESLLYKQMYESNADNTGMKVWRIELPLNATRRLKYAFIIEASDGDKKYYSGGEYQEYSQDTIAIYHNQFFFPFIHEEDAPSIPQWAGDVVWYQIFPERFYSGDDSLSPDGIADWDTDTATPNNFFGGDIIGIRKKLSYIKSLGVTGIYLNPVFKAPSNHKYDTEDYFTIDEHFGDIDDLKTLIDEAHGLGIKVMLDAVFNHIGSAHPFWQDVLINQEKSKYKDYFHIKSFPVYEKYENRKEINYDTFGFSVRMPKWNTHNQQAKKYLLEAATYWIKECDIDAWRLDVADEVSFEFWQEFSNEVRKVKKDFYVVGEIWHDATKWISPGYFDSVMNYPLGLAIKNMFLSKEMDGREFTKRLFYELTRYSDLHTSVMFNIIDTHDTQRALSVAKFNKQSLKNAFTMMFLLPGSPSIYYGTEVGMYGEGDPYCRNPMIWNEGKQDLMLLDFFKRLIALRKKYMPIISAGNICYGKKGDIHTWTLGTEQNGIVIMYNIGVETELLIGNIIFYTGDSTNEFLPNTMAVYEIK